MIINYTIISNDRLLLEDDLLQVPSSINSLTQVFERLNVENRMYRMGGGINYQSHIHTQ